MMQPFPKNNGDDDNGDETQCLGKIGKEGSTDDKPDSECRIERKPYGGEGCSEAALITVDTR